MRRIHVTGNSSSGKSTFAAALADAIGAEFVELDALNWLPDWVGLNATDPDKLVRRFADATSGDTWVAAGSYMT
ncbi:MAG: AAA family ATPase, partial [Gammaproteobacteria bacterium]|nr:AAA family ATPase [Gammaproteobacteria bacterium]